MGIAVGRSGKKWWYNLLLSSHVYGVSKTQGEEFMNRYTIQFTPQFDALLAEIGSIEGVSKAEAIRRSVAVFGFLNKELIKGHRRLLIVNDDTGETMQIVLPANLAFATSGPSPTPVARSRKNSPKFDLPSESERVPEPISA
jgi:hypothetical protein